MLLACVVTTVVAHDDGCDVPKCAPDKCFKDGSRFYCTECEGGWGLNPARTCNRCPENCIRCYQFDKCSSCETGYQEKNGQCFKASIVGGTTGSSTNLSTNGTPDIGNLFPDENKNETNSSAHQVPLGSESKMNYWQLGLGIAGGLLSVIAGALGYYWCKHHRTPTTVKPEAMSKIQSGNQVSSSQMSINNSPNNTIKLTKTLKRSQNQGLMSNSRIDTVGGPETTRALTKSIPQVSIIGKTAPKIGISREVFWQPQVTPVLSMARY